MRGGGGICMRGLKRGGWEYDEKGGRDWEIEKEKRIEGYLEVWLYICSVFGLINEAVVVG